jgi:hypothetical protein
MIYFVVMDPDVAEDPDKWPYLGPMRRDMPSPHARGLYYQLWLDGWRIAVVDSEGVNYVPTDRGWEPITEPLFTPTGCRA